MEPSFKLLTPETEKPVQHRKIRVKIVFLPDIALQQPGMIRTAVENVSRGQAVAGELPGKILRGQFVLLSANAAHLRMRFPRRAPAAALTPHAGSCKKDSPRRRVLDNAPRLGPIILTGPRGRPWTAGAFRNVWIKTARAAGVTGLHFHDLRGTAVTRLFEAGCSVAECASISGHSLSDAAAILDRYTARTDRLAVQAIIKLEQRKKTT